MLHLLTDLSENMDAVSNYKNIYNRSMEVKLPEPTFKEIMTDRPTDKPTDKSGHREVTPTTGEVIGELDLQ